MCSSAIEEGWQARVVTVILTRHARKKLERRFQLADPDDQDAAVLQVVLDPEETWPRRGGATAWRRGDMVLVTHPDGIRADAWVVTTAFPKGQMGKHKERRRALYKRLKREMRESMEDEDNDDLSSL